MEFWVLWFIGVVIVVGTRIAICKIVRNPDTYNSSKVRQCVMLLLISICISLVGGILVAKFIGNFAYVDPSELGIAWSIVIMIFLTIMGAVLTYLCGYLILGLCNFDSKLLQIYFVVIFAVSIIGWSIPIWNYNQNIEMTTETIVEQKQERELLYFCDIPVQKISGTISGSHFLGSGEISGEITTLDRLSYLYLNKNGEGIYDSAPTTSSKIIFIEDGKPSYVEVVQCATQKITKNCNNGIEKSTIGKKWTAYYFYLPKAIIQYNLN